MNKVILYGNLCFDVELSENQNGISVVKNTIATRNNFKNANGEYESEFHNIKVYRKIAEFMAQYLKKGDSVLAEGRLHHYSQDLSDGTKKYFTEVIVENLVGTNFSRNEEQDESDSEVDDLKSPDPFEEFGNEVKLTDDDLPF